MIQCWDDGVTADIPVIEILRKYGAKASFNLNGSLHGKERGVFYFWGHTYEILDKKMLSDFKAMIGRIDEDPHAEWEDLPAIFSRS